MSTAIIGGSGFTQLPELAVTRRAKVSTPFGAPSAPLLFGALGGREYIFLSRHGASHTIAPHRINYRANLRALKDAGASRVVAFAAVGGIGENFSPGKLALPHQLIDYTWGRAHSFCDGVEGTLRHIDFEPPYDETLRAKIIQAARTAGVEIIPRATYAVMQGPRLETAAEIDRIERDGANLVGMTGMPEASLARELELPYACIALIMNPAAGRGEIERECMLRELQGCARLALKILLQLE